MNSIIKDWSDLIRRVIAKDRIAQAQFIEDTQKDLFQFCFYLTHNRQFAEDLLHDTYLKGFESLASLKNSNSLLSWLKQIARFLYLDYVKSAAFRNEVQSDTDLELAIDESADKKNKQIDVLKILGKLDEADRTVLILIDIQGCDYEETASILQVPVGTVKSRLFRAREKFSSFYNGTKRRTSSS